MAIQQTPGTLTNSVRTAYAARYMEQAELMRMYDRFAVPVSTYGVEQAAKLNSTVQIPFLSEMTPGTTTISQVTDVTPSTLRDATVTMTPTSRWGALQWSELMELEAYTNYGEERFKRLGRNQMETVDLVAQAVVLQGTNAIGNNIGARSSVDAGTAADRLTEADFSQAEMRLLASKVPAFLGNGRNQYISLMRPETFYDLRTGGNVVSVAQYQAKEIILNWELGSIGPFKIVVSPFAKAFWGAGAANAAAVDTTIGAATVEFATSIAVTDTDLAAGAIGFIGTVETGNTHYATNERVIVQAYTAGTATVSGEAENGGLRHPHASGSVFSTDDSVYPVVWGGPSSIMKMFDAGTGEFGTIVGPRKDGLLDQFGSIGWKWYGNYGRIAQSWILRGEYSSSLEA